MGTTVDNEPRAYIDRHAQGAALSRALGIDQGDMIQICYRIARKAPPGESEDCLQTVCAVLLDKRPDNGALAWGIARIEIAYYWRLWHKRSHYTATASEPARLDALEAKRATLDNVPTWEGDLPPAEQRKRARSRDGRMATIERRIESLSDYVDREATVGALQYTLEMANDCDAKAVVKALPPRIRAIYQKRINGERLSGADSVVLSGFRKSDKGKRLHGLLAAV